MMVVPVGRRGASGRSQAGFSRLWVTCAQNDRGQVLSGEALPWRQQQAPFPMAQCIGKRPVNLACRCNGLARPCHH